MDTSAAVKSTDHYNHLQVDIMNQNILQGDLNCVVYVMILLIKMERFLQSYYIFHFSDRCCIPVHYVFGPMHFIGT